MNGVAKQFWSEMHDLRAPVSDDDRGRKAIRRGKKTPRRTQTLVRKAGRTAA